MRPSGAPSNIQLNEGGPSSRLICQDGCGGLKPPCWGKPAPPLPPFSVPLWGETGEACEAQRVKPKEADGCNSVMDSSIRMEVLPVPLVSGGLGPRALTQDDQVIIGAAFWFREQRH